jgi:hypothetical protein
MKRLILYYTYPGHEEKVGKDITAHNSAELASYKALLEAYEREFTKQGFTVRIVEENI